MQKTEFIIPYHFSYNSEVLEHITYGAPQFDWSIWHRWDLGRHRSTIAPVRRSHPAALWTARALPSLSSRRTSLARRCQTDRRLAFQRTASDAVRRPRRPLRCAPCDRHTSTSAFLPTNVFQCIEQTDSTVVDGAPTSSFLYRAKLSSKSPRTHGQRLGPCGLPCKGVDPPREDSGYYSGKYLWKLHAK